MEHGDMSALETATRLDSTMEQLTALLSAESEGVYARSTREMAAFCEEKARLFASYVSALNALHDSSAEKPVTLPQSLKASLQEKYGTLTVAMKKNLHALSVATDASKRVVTMIVEAVQQQRQTGAGYGLTKTGLLTEKEGTAHAVTLDTRL